MPHSRFAFGRIEDAYHPDMMSAALSEFLATAIFVFAAEGSVVSVRKLLKDSSTAGGLTVVAIAHGLALFVAVSVAFNISGGHVNPAVTFGASLAVESPSSVLSSTGLPSSSAPLWVRTLWVVNILAGGAFDGAAMNPARVFGPALVGWRWKRHWVYWVGPLLGGGLAGLVYEFLVMQPEVQHVHQPLAPEDY